jgi:2-oxoisovalerate dehydrogenase E1 component
MNYENYLKEIGLLDDTKIAAIRAEIKKDMEAGLEEVFAMPEVVCNEEEELADMYRPYETLPSTNYGNLQNVVEKPATDAISDKRLIDALSEAMAQSMERHPNLVLMGQDIAEYGGAFKITQGFVEKFGKARVRNTPLCESAIVGAAYGLSIKGHKAMMEMQFADFVTCGFNQIINNLAKSHYRWAQNADVVVRMPTGAGTGAGPFHSQSNEAWFFHTPGLKVVYPSTPSDAKGLLCAAFNDPNPVIFFEHKAMYRSSEEPVYNDYYTIEIGKARTARSGDELSIITYGAAVHWAIAECEKQGIDADIIDLRTLLPWDKEAVEATVKKTGRVLVFHEDTLTGGIGGEIAAWIGENCFQYLDAPVLRVGSLDTAVPLAKDLEDHFLPKKRLTEALEKLSGF